MNTIPRKLGRYVVIREIGRGAMGVVYKAHDPVIEREVAIKAIQISFEVTAEEKKVYLNRFYREAKAAGKLSHPNIVTIYDVDEDPETGTPFIVMEFLEGTTISEVAVSGVLLPLEDVNNVIVQLADALHYAHAEGVVHRDIKAANILVLPGMKVKIMDFGIARLQSSELTQSGEFMGTPNYMSPEQIDGRYPVDGRSDLFSLGIIFYMLLTGERPFTGDSFNTVSYKIVHVDPVSPRTLNANVPEAYNAILAKLLAKEPADRYQTGAELIADLKKLMERTVPPEELTEQDLDFTKEGQYPPPLPPGRQPNETPTGRSPTARVITLGLMILAVAGLTFAAISLIRFSGGEKKQVSAPPVIAKQPDPVAEMSRQNSIRIKWDLAMKYMESGNHENAIREINDIIRLDPKNHDAQKFLDLVVEKKALEEKLQLPAPGTEPEPLEKVPARRQPVPRATPVSTIEPLPPVQQEVKTGLVDFEFEHGFPSGSFYIFTDDKLAYEANLVSEKKQVLMFKNYKGVVTGSVEVPAGKTNLLIHVVCREKEVSASKRMMLEVSENGRYKLRIRYSKSPKQLEVKLL